VARAEHFAQYRHEFSHDALKAKFFEFLDKVVAQPKRRAVQNVSV
jgi:hypothetical protein